MKATNQEKVIVSLAIIILTIAAILYSMQPNEQAGAVEFTAGTEAEQAHYFLNSETESRPAMQNDVTASLIGDCLADRANGDLYPQPDPYCLPVPSVQTVEQARERDTGDTDTPVIVDVPATPETPVIVPTEEPETPETPSTPETPETEPSQAGNPGNLKNVGNAGENPNGRGTMDNDNAGGNGNGQHGNQGEGGNGHNN